MSTQVEQLEFASQVFGEWVAHTAMTRDRAERSEFELRARGVDIHAPDDRVKASEWLAGQRDDEAEAERDQLVREEYDWPVVTRRVGASSKANTPQTRRNCCS